MGAMAMESARENVRLPTVNEARQSLLDRVEEMAPIELPLQEATGLVIAHEIQAEVNVPEFASSRIEGFAVRASDVHGASTGLPATLTIAGRALAGRAPEGTVGWGEAIRIAAGGLIPAGSDTVVPLEDAVVEGETVRVLHSWPSDSNIQPAGEDLRAGTTLIPTGRKLGPPETALLAASGRMGALVFPRPRVVVLTTGDGLVDPQRAAAVGQTRDATSLTLYAALKEVGATPYLGGIVPDDIEALKEALLSHLATVDCYLLAGRSAGVGDILRAALFRRGEVEGLPVGLDSQAPLAIGTFEGKPLFGLPGDTVEVFTAFEVFVRPALLKMMGRRDLLRPEVRAELVAEVAGANERARFCRVRVWMERGRWKAVATGERSSTRLAAMAGANGLALVPAGRARLRAGEEARVMVFRPLER
jgi:molybdopterin molybdotransferase